MSLQDKRNNIIDFYKGVAMIAIVLCHCAQTITFPQSIFFAFGQMGCQIFLVLSAFVLCCSYDKKRPKYSQYIFLRYCRLASGYWIAILIYLGGGLFSLIILGYNCLGTNISPLGIIVNALLLNGLFPGAINNNVVLGGWYVGTLFVFYIIFPFLWSMCFGKANTKYFGLRQLLFVFMIFFISFCLLKIIESHTNLTCSNNSFLYFSIINQLPCLTIGMIIYGIIRQYGSYISDIQIFRWGGYGTFLILLLTSWKLFQSYYHIPYVFTLCPLSMAIAFSSLLLVTYNLRSSNKFIIIKMISKIGILSFGIYLFHPFFAYHLIPLILRIVTEAGYHDILNFSPIFAFAILSMIVLILSSLVAIIFEKITKIINLKCKLFTPKFLFMINR